MQLFPTRPTVHVALAALGTLTAGIVLRQPAVVAWGGAMIAGIGLARATAKLAVLRVRAAGLEMVWRTNQKVRRVARGSEVLLEVELKNRDRAPVRYTSLRAIGSTELEISVQPAEGTIAGSTSQSLSIRVRAPRIGHHCLHGLALEVRGPPGLFEVPLAFANPLGIEVLPRPFVALVSSPRGGRSRRYADASLPNPRPGAGTALYELREHVSGDAFKRIAWRASARRGKLMVREFEQETRDVVWLILDASAELLAGPLGLSPLERSIDEMAALATRHLAEGDRVGLALLGAPPASWLAPAGGPAHALRIAHALVKSVSLLDSDRSEYDEHDVARRVLDHLRFLDATSAAKLRSDDFDSLQSHAEAARARAPFDLPAPLAKTPREQSLRRYLACFGIASPPRVLHNRPRSINRLLPALGRALVQIPRPSVVYVFAPAPSESSEELSSLVRQLRRRGITVRWSTAREDAALETTSSDLARAVADAVRIRAGVAEGRGARLLRGMGIKMLGGVRS